MEHTRETLAWRAVLCGLPALIGAALALAVVRAAPATAAPAQPQGGCENGTQPGGALYMICMPFLPWNGELIIYAHGYVTPGAPLAIPAEAAQLAQAVNFQGYAFATTSYRKNGLAIVPGVQDVLELAQVFSQAHGAAERVYVAGASEGGLVATLAVERHPDVFAGGSAVCAPIGDFRRQVDHFGDFRVVFDYFFPGLLPGSPISVPQPLINDWPNYYSGTVKPVLQAPGSALSLTQLLSVTQAAYDPLNPTSIYSTVESLLWYNVFATSDAIVTLGGQPYDNQGRTYTGSLNDAALNAGVQRFAADPAALAAIEAGYQTTGRLTSPLVVRHTSLDPVVPAWHAELYTAKAAARGRQPRLDLAIFPRYGHCNFTLNEAAAASNRLAEMAANLPPLRLYLPAVVRP